MSRLGGDLAIFSAVRLYCVFRTLLHRGLEGSSLIIQPQLKLDLARKWI
jgi:hypothetical protein